MRVVAQAVIFFAAVSALSAEAEGDLYDLSLAQLINVQIKSTSLVEEPLSQTSYSVTASESSEWPGMGLRNLGELLNRMPSSVAPPGRGQARWLAIRGYLDTEPASGVAVRLDGVPINKIREGSGLMAIDGFDMALLERAELVRGPGSALHGNAAFHGVFSIDTVTPQSSQLQTNVALGSLDYSAASLLATKVAGDHSVTLGAAYRNIGDVNQAYDYIDNSSGELASSSRKHARENTNLLAKYRFHPGELAFNATMYLQRFEAEQLPGTGVSVLGDQQDEDYADYKDDMQFVSVSGEREFSDASRLDVRVFYWQYQDAFRLDADQMFAVAHEYISRREESHRGLHFHHTLAFTGQSYLTYGYEYLAAQLDAISLQQKYPGEDWLPESLEPGAGYQRELHSLLVDGRQALTNSGPVLAYGLRWDAYNDFSEQLTPRLGLSQRLGTQHQLHLTYGEGFRAPTTFELFGGGPLAPNHRLEPERLESTELKYTLETRHVFHSFTLFYNQWREAIVVKLLDQEVNGLLAQHQNQGNASSRGAEYELKASGSRWQMEFSASYVDDVNDETGEHRRGFPEWMADFKLTYSLGEQWQTGLLSRYMDVEPFQTDFGPAEPNTYLRNDLSLGWQGRTGLNVNFVLRNIFDRDQALNYSLGWKDGLQDEGRNFSVQLSYPF